MIRNYLLISKNIYCWKKYRILLLRYATTFHFWISTHCFDLKEIAICSISKDFELTGLTSLDPWCNIYVLWSFWPFLTFFRAYTYVEIFLIPIPKVILKVKTAGCLFSWLLMIWIWAASYFYNSLLNRLNQYMVNLANSTYHEWSVLWEVYCETFLAFI